MICGSAVMKAAGANHRMSDQAVARLDHHLSHRAHVGHAPYADPGKDFPKGIDISFSFPNGVVVNLPVATEAGVIGWRPSDGKLIPPLWSELMSYGTPAPKFGDGTVANYDDRWPSIALWNRLFDQLK